MENRPFSGPWRTLTVFVPAAVILLSGVLPVHAQSGGYTNPYTGNTWNNPISSYLDTVIQNRQQQQMMNNQMFSQMLFHQMVMDSLLRKTGRERIAAGRASTRFTPSAGSAPSYSLVSADAAPQEKQKALASYRACLYDFHSAMKRFGLQPYDVADARALAFTMAFTAMQGKDPGPVRLKNLRAQFRSAMMKDALFQALPDSERQSRYERMVIPAMIAVTARRQSSRPGVEAERKAVLLTTAERMGADLLKGLWTEPVEAIELSPNGFVDRGRRVVASGAGRTVFERTTDSAAVREAGANYTNQSFGWDEKYQQALLDRFDAAVGKMGLNKCDLADCQAAAAAVIYPVFSDGKTTLGPAQIAWLQKEMRKDILSSPEIQRMTDVQRQDLYEKVALRAMHIRVRDEQMRDEIARLSGKSEDAFENIGNAGVVQADKRVLETNRANAYSLLKEIFNPRDFDAYRVSPEGFRKR